MMNGREESDSTIVAVEADEQRGAIPPRSRRSQGWGPRETWNRTARSGHRAERRRVTRPGPRTESGKGKEEG